MPAPNSNTDWLANPIYDDRVGLDSPTYQEPPILPQPPIRATAQNNDVAKGGNNNDSQGSGRTIGFGGNNIIPQPKRTILPPISGNISVGAAAQTPTLLYVLLAVVAIFIFRKPIKRRR